MEKSAQAITSASETCSVAFQLQVTVRPGDNITLYCDCKASAEEFIVWYQNCTHENQPSLVLKLKEDPWKPTSNPANYINSLPRFHFVKNRSFDSYDLLIMNITNSDEGLYYCGAGQRKVEDEKYITSKNVYSYGNVTRILLSKYSGLTSLFMLIYRMYRIGPCG
uniref:Ig-like domain-containing protein n=1 Tax=Lates calcarifer TaxID=8187 RepID=A0A4W6G8H9_LATCA